MKEISKNKIVKNMADLSLYFILLILIIAPILSEKTIFFLILIDGLIAFIGFILLITEKETEKEFNKEDKIKGYKNGI